jgi:putative ABC transport system substrate-binding protein
MNRRAVMAMLGGAAAESCVSWPLAARAQQGAMPVIGFISVRSADDRQGLAEAFRRGLGELGFVERQNVAIEYRWADFQFDRLPALAVDLVGRKVAVIAAISGTPTVKAAKAATATIPIVFAIGSDPITAGVVTSLNRPGGNITGTTIFGAALGAKRLEVLRMLVPQAATIAVLVDPDNPVSAADGADMQAAARAVGQPFDVFNARADQIEGQFERMTELRIGALFVTGDAFFVGQRDKLVALAARHAIPAIYFARTFVAAGGLMSYGTIENEAVRQAGVYVARILKGAKPGDLPVMLPTKFELVINLKTARALNLQVPDKLLALADEVIE